MLVLRQGCFSLQIHRRVKAALILGVQSGFPCPICLVPFGMLLDRAHIWPFRTVKDTRNLIHEARSLKTKTARAKKRREQSVRDVDVRYIAIYPLFIHRTDVYIRRVPSSTRCILRRQSTISLLLIRVIWQVGSRADMIILGRSNLCRRLRWQRLTESILSRLCDCCHVLTCLHRASFSCLHPYPDIHHFPRGPTTLKRLSWKEHSTIARVLCQIIAHRPSTDWDLPSTSYLALRDFIRRTNQRFFDTNGGLPSLSSCTSSLCRRMRPSR